MKTFPIALLVMCFLALAVILLSPILWAWKGLFIIAVLSVSYREIRRFSVQHIHIQGDKVLVTEHGRVYEATYLPSSVVAHHVCLLHLSSVEAGKRWYIPVSRLEFPGESFRRLKCALQRFSMRTI